MIGVSDTRGWLPIFVSGTGFSSPQVWMSSSSSGFILSSCRHTVYLLFISQEHLFFFFHQVKPVINWPLPQALKPPRWNISFLIFILQKDSQLPSRGNMFVPLAHGFRGVNPQFHCCEPVIRQNIMVAWGSSEAGFLI